MKSGRSNQKKRILIVDDHPMMRQGLAQLIENEPDLTVIGEANDAEEALEKIFNAPPDLVLADITLPGKNGLELIKDAQAAHPDLPMLIISMHDETLYAERVLRAGGRGYIMKQEGGKRIMHAIRHVLSGQIFVSEKISAQILEAFSGQRGPKTASPIETLTDREFEVFELVGKGCETKDIGERLHVSTKTVDVHRANIKAKLKLKTMGELIRYAVRWVESQGESH